MINQVGKSAEHHWGTPASAITFAQASPLLATVRSVGDPIAVLPTAFHLMWSGVLHADLAARVLTGSALVWAGSAPR